MDVVPVVDYWSSIFVAWYVFWDTEESIGAINEGSSILGYKGFSNFYDDSYWTPIDVMMEAWILNGLRDGWILCGDKWFLNFGRDVDGENILEYTLFFYSSLLFPTTNCHSPSIKNSGTLGRSK